MCRADSSLHKNEIIMTGYSLRGPRSRVAYFSIIFVREKDNQAPSAAARRRPRRTRDYQACPSRVAFRLALGSESKVESIPSLRGLG